MSLKIIGVLINFTALATIVFPGALSEYDLPNNELISPMNDDYQLDNETIQSIEFIRMKEKEFQLGPEEEAVVILGNDSAGKSSLSLLLTDGEMKSIKESGTYKFVDENNRICKEFDCDMHLPVIDTFNDTTYYDWSGFRHSSEHLWEKVLPSHLLKKFARSKKSVKFVFVVPTYYFDITYHTRIHGAPEWLAWNTPFFKFAKIANDLFVDIDKYRNAIGFVVTRSVTRRSKKKPVTDETILRRVVFYLNSLRDGLTDHLKRDDQQGYDVNSLIQLIDILLEKNGENYKIGVFEQPTEEGSAKTLMNQRNNKIAIRSMVANQLRFVKSDANDFGYVVEYATKRTNRYKKLMLGLEILSVFS